MLLLLLLVLLFIAPELLMESAFSPVIRLITQSEDLKLYPDTDNAQQNQTERC